MFREVYGFVLDIDLSVGREMEKFVKIGEGVYGEVFIKEDEDGEVTILKVRVIR